MRSSLNKRQHLTLVPIPVTFAPSNLARRRALSRCDPESGASAVPAGGFANRSRAAPGPRSTGMTTGLRGARLTEDRPKRVTPATPGLRKRGTGAEPKVDASALASAAAERREASDPRWGRVRARALSGGNVCGADNWLVRLSALRLPSLLDGRQRFGSLVTQNSGAQAPRERIFVRAKDAQTGLHGCKANIRKA